MNFQSTVGRRRLLTRASVAAVIPLVPLQMGRAQSTPSASPIASPVVIHPDMLSDIVTAILDAKGIPGAIVSIDAPGQDRWEQGFGVSDIATGTVISVDDHFRTGSVTKTMTATLVLQLVNDGLLGLDDTVQDLVPDLEHGAEITVRHLLSMSSGLFDILDDEQFLPSVIADPLRAWTPAEMLEIANAQDLEFEPGTDMQYSNTNYIVLGQIIEELTGSALPDVFAERIFTPLGMEQTSLPDSPELPVPFSHGYIDPAILDFIGIAPPRGTAAGQAPDYTNVEPSVGWAGGGVVSTVGDLQTWMNELLSGTLVGVELQRERFAFQSSPTRESGMDYGLGVARFGDVVGHDGSFIGFQTFAGRAPSGVTIVSMVNLEPTADGDGVASEIAFTCFEALAGS